MIISEEEKNRIRNLHNEYFILNEQGLGGMASVGSGFVNKQGGTGRVEKFINRQTELGEGYYDFGELDLDDRPPKPLVKPATDAEQRAGQLAWYKHNERPTPPKVQQLDNYGNPLEENEKELGEQEEPLPDDDASIR